MYTTCGCAINPNGQQYVTLLSHEHIACGTCTAGMQACAAVHAIGARNIMTWQHNLLKVTCIWSVIALPVTPHLVLAMHTFTLES